MPITDAARPAPRVVAVTGVREFLGAHLLRALEQNPSVRHVLAIDLGEPLVEAKKVTTCRLDLTLPEAGHTLADLFARHQVDTVVHLAFLNRPAVSQSYAHELQVIGSMHLLNAIAASAVTKLVMLGSTMSYGAQPDNPNFLKETSPLKGGRHFRLVGDWVEAERQLWEFSARHPHITTTVLRMASLLGPQSSGMIAQWLAPSAVPTVLGYDPLMQFVHQQDAARALMLAVDGQFPGAYNIAAEGVLPLSTVLNLGGRLSLPVPHFLWEKIGGVLWSFQATATPPALMSYLRYLWVVDGTKARKVMGFAPRYTTRETLLAYYRLGQLNHPASREDETP